VTSAIYRSPRRRWQISGTVSHPTSSVQVYKNSVAPENLIGAAIVDTISGAWDVNTTTSPVVGVAGDTVIAVSSGGGVSDPRTVTIRDR